LPYISQGEYYVDIEAIAYEHNDNYNPQFYIYEPQKLTYKNKHSHINNDININDDNDSSSSKGIVFRCLLIFVFILVMLVLWMFRKIRYEKTKHRSEHIEYNKLYDDNKNYNTA
jgi:ATP-dependent Zn protease